MYSKIAIEPLSDTQKRNLIKGRGVRVRHNPTSAQHLYLSAQQLKQLARAHRMGRGITLTMDPHQSNCHQRDGVYGSGIFGKKFDKFVAKTIGQKAKDKLYAGLNTVGKPLAKMAIGKAAKMAEALGVPGPAVGAIRQTAQNYIDDPGKFQTRHGFPEQIAASAMQGAMAGSGIKFHAKPKKKVVRRRGGALYPAGGALYPAGQF